MPSQPESGLVNVRDIVRLSLNNWRDKELYDRELGVHLVPAHKPKTPKVFVSYSWDSEIHKEWVLNFASRLRREGGIEVVLDRWHLPLGADKTAFMEKAIDRSKFVVLVCTPKYAKRANKRQGGVGYEATIVTGTIAENIRQQKSFPFYVPELGNRPCLSGQKRRSE
jgi:TIR domain